MEVTTQSRRRADVAHIPVLGFIAAGQPVPVFSSDDLTQSDPVETLEISNGMLGGRKLSSNNDLYALRVRGTSMIEDMIDDGDVVIVRPANQIRDGEMVVVWLKKEKEATLKRLYREGDRVRLQPANSQMEPIYTAADNVEVQGKVVAMFRNFS